MYDYGIMAYTHKYTDLHWFMKCISKMKYDDRVLLSSRWNVMSCMIALHAISIELFGFAIAEVGTGQGEEIKVHNRKVNMLKHRHTYYIEFTITICNSQIQTQTKSFLYVCLSVCLLLLIYLS